jgi:hypothetical protein
MTSTNLENIKRTNYQSLHNTPGNSSGIISDCLCEKIQGKKIAFNSNPKINNQSLTEIQKRVNVIKYLRGGKTIFNNPNLNVRNNLKTFLGKTEGQLGGINSPLKNRF